MVTLVQNLLSSGLLFDNVKIEMFRTISMPVVVCGCEAWSVTLRDERGLSVFQNRVLLKIFGSKWDELFMKMEILFFSMFSMICS